MRSLKTIADVDNLHACYHHTSVYGGPSPGVDGITYDDIGRSECSAMLRDLSERILDGAYVPDPLCAVRIPKASGGFRTLRVATIRDRVVARAVLLAIEPILDPIFKDNSHGFRPHRSPWTLLAALEQMMIAHQQPVLVNADIRGEFDHVKISAVMDPMAKVFDGHQKRYYGSTGRQMGPRCSRPRSCVAWLPQRNSR